MAAPKGNRFWEARSSHGKDKIFTDQSILWEAAQEYFIWVEDNPLKGAKLFKIKNDNDKDEITESSYSKMRAMTLMGLCIFLDICDATWANYRKKHDLLGVVKKVEEIIYTQKLTGAAADLLNSNIICRELGLKDAKDHTSSDGTMTPITVIGPEMDAKAAAEIYNRNINRKKD